MAIQASPAPSPEASVGESFAWPLRDPEWLSKFVLMGLISIIPIVGWLQLLGWMLAALDNLRHGWQQLPPAAFRYASRGLHLFLASLVWFLVMLILVYGTFGLMVFGMVAMTPKPNADTGSTAAPFFMFPVMFGVMGLFTLASLVGFLFLPLIILFTERKGFGGAFNIAGFVRAIRASPRESLAAGGLMLVSYLIGELGSYLCYVGLLFTIPYSMAVIAGVLRWYEVHAKPSALPASAQ